MVPASLALWLLAAAPSPSKAPVRATRANWQHHPAVEAARAVYAEVKEALESKRLEPKLRADCTQELSTFWVASDSSGVIRYLVRDFGSEDSSHRYEQYYDSAGRLRFAFAKVGAVPNAWVEARFWLDADGKVVWSTRQTGGEGPHYYAQKAEDVLVRHPQSYLTERTRCVPAEAVDGGSSK